MANELTILPEQKKNLTDILSEYIKSVFDGYEKSELKLPNPNPNSGQIFYECCIIFSKTNSIFCDDIENKIYSKGYFNILVDNVPNSITQLFFVRNLPMDKIIIPKSITHLTFGHSFNQKVNQLPNTIKVLTFGNDFNKPVNFLPNSITHLTFGKNFNKSANDFPKSIKYLVFGHNFNRHINDLPNSIIHLTIGHDFDKPINKLPNSIKYIKINRPSNISEKLLQEIKTLLPNTFIDIELLSELPIQKPKTLIQSPSIQSPSIQSTSLTHKYNNLLDEITELFRQIPTQHLSNPFVDIELLSELPTQTFLLDSVSKSSNKKSSQPNFKSQPKPCHILRPKSFGISLMG